MDMIPLIVSVRDSSRSPKQLRHAGVSPCVVYGSGLESTPIQCETNILQRTFGKAGESTIVELDLDGKKIPVLFKAISFHPVSSRAMHADFYAVNMKEDIETSVPVTFTGESLAVKELGAIFVATMEEVTVRCLPSKLPHELVVDISALTEFHMSVHVSDLQVPAGVEVLDDPEAVLATVQQPREDEPEPEVAAVEGAAADGAAPAEGEAAAEGEKKE